MTDIALEKSHWKIMAFVMCPCYMLANCWGSLGWKGIDPTLPGYGMIYGVEMWGTHPYFSVPLFIVAAFLQGGLFYCLCSIVEKCWPKREAEKFESLLNIK